MNTAGVETHVILMWIGLEKSSPVSSCEFKPALGTAVLQNFGNTVFSLCQCLSEETLKKLSVSSIYNVYAKGSKIFHTVAKCVTCRGLSSRLGEWMSVTRNIS